MMEKNAVINVPQTVEYFNESSLNERMIQKIVYNEESFSLALLTLLLYGIHELPAPA
jgi:hypothetical protein